MEKTGKFTRISELDNIRLDLYLARELLPSRTQLQNLIRQGKIRVDEKIVAPSYKLKKGEKVSIEIPPQPANDLKPEKIPLDILFEDKYILVINKPAGLVIHPAPGNYSGTLVNALIYHCPGISAVGHFLRPGIVHRLDKETSGVMVIAKTLESYLNLVEQFRWHKIKKKYLSLVKGRMPDKSGKIELPLKRDPYFRKRCIVSHSGKSAVTIFKVLKYLQDKKTGTDFTLLELTPQTGRTHQIRVHLAALGFPVAGDKEYGKSAAKLAERQMLHALSLGFFHPRTDKFVDFQVPLPDDLKKLIARLKED